jgi:hypothetical protein
MALLLALLLSAPVCAAAQGAGADAPEAMMQDMTRSLGNLSAAKPDDVNDPKVAAEWALWELLEDIRKQRGEGAAKPQPSPDLMDVYLRMIMRLRVEELRRFGSKPYPGEDDFRWAADEAAKGVQAYLAALKPGEDVRLSRHRSAVEALLVKALKRMISFRLRSGRGRSAAEPPSGYAPGLESTYVNKARMNKRGALYFLPPWPDKR